MMALKLGVPPLCLYSDSAFFVTGWVRGRAWCIAPGRAHADVWRRFWDVVQDFGGVDVITVLKVKGHATKNMVDMGEVLEIDRWGNDQADDAAKRGAAMHPPVRDTMSKIEVSRAVAQQAVQWLGVGLEEAQRTGSMPVELTSAEKRGRPQLRPLKRLEVIPDEVWQHERRELHFTKGAHATHSLKKTGAFWFCEVCGCHGSQKLVALSEPCTRATTPSRKYLLKRLLAGCHPRTGDFLGDVERAEPVDELLFSATRRRSHSV